jgi:hypothetical protein
METFMPNRTKLAALPRDDSPRAATRPVTRESTDDRLNRGLAAAQIEQLFDSYVSLMVRRQPGPGHRGRRSRLRRRIDGLQDLGDTIEMLYSMQSALGLPGPARDPLDPV